MNRTGRQSIVSACAASPIDHHSADFARDHQTIYREARAAGCPALRSSAHGGFTIVTRYADNRAGLSDAGTFTSGRYPAGKRLGGGVAIPPNAIRIGMIEMDGAEAVALRALLRPWFTIKAIEAASARIGQISRWLIDTVIGRGSLDAVANLARPMPSLLILDVLGLPLERWAEYGRVLHEAVAKSGRSYDRLRR